MILNLSLFITRKVPISLLKDELLSLLQIFIFKKIHALHRFEIQKKLKKAKKEQKKSKSLSDQMLPTVSERSKERRKHIEQRKDNKKTSAFQDLKAKREEQKKKGLNCTFFFLCFFKFFL